MSGIVTDTESDGQTEPRQGERREVKKLAGKKEKLDSNGESGRESTEQREELTDKNGTIKNAIS